MLSFLYWAANLASAGVFADSPVDPACFPPGASPFAFCDEPPQPESARVAASIIERTIHILRLPITIRSFLGDNWAVYSIFDVEWLHATHLGRVHAASRLPGICHVVARAPEAKAVGPGASPTCVPRRGGSPDALGPEDGFGPRPPTKARRGHVFDEGHIDTPQPDVRVIMALCGP